MIYNDCIKTKEKSIKSSEATSERQHANTKQRNDTENSKEGGAYCCMDCKKRFATHGAYILHLKEEHSI